MNNDQKSSETLHVDLSLVKGDTDNRERKAKLVISHKENAFREVRCKSCSALLYRVLQKSKGSNHVEIKCRRCGTMNYD